VLPIAPSTYHDHAAKRREPERLSDRAKRDEALKPAIRRIFDGNFSVYGVRKSLPPRRRIRANIRLARWDRVGF